MESGEYGSLYADFLPKAQQIVATFVGGISYDEVKIVAHDLVVDFLFFSKSFSDYFDPEKGTLVPYFKAYVRKKCRGVRERHFTPCVPLDEAPIKELAVQDSFSWWFEFGSEIRRLKKLLGTTTSSGVNLGDLLVANLVLSMWDETDKFDELSEIFGVSVVRLKRALKDMQRKVILYNGTFNFGGAINRRNKKEGLGGIPNGSSGDSV